MYPPHHLGGYELTWRSWVSQLRRSGHEVRVLTTDYRSPAPGIVASADDDVHRELRWYWHDHGFPPIGHVERLRLERHNGRVLARHLAQLRPDAVAWWAMGGMSLSLIERVRRADIPAVGVVGDLWMLYGPKVDAWFRAVRRLGVLGRLVGAMAGVPATLDLGGAARWLYVSEVVRQRSREAGGPLPDTRVVHPGIDPEVFVPKQRGAWRGRLLYVGRLDQRKGVGTALEALERLPAQNTLRIVGDGDRSYARSLEERAASKILRGRVTFSAQVSQRELAGIYASADAVLFPAIWSEPWGLVPLEAMACGTPVIATGTGGSGEYLCGGRNCLLVEPGDSAALAHAVSRLAADAGVRESLRSAGFESSARYTERAYNASIEEALVEVVRAAHTRLSLPDGAERH